MKYAIKNKKVLVHAYRLGDGSAMERQLIEEGAIRCLPDGRYELFSQEAVHGSGELAQRGDYFKVDTVDGRHYPYPNTRAYFEANHTLADAAQDLYEQKPTPRRIWQKEDGMCPEIAALLHADRLCLNPADPQHYFSAFLYLKTKDLYPLQIFLRQILVQANFDSEMLDPDALEQMQNLQQILKYAIIVVSTAPMVLFYPFVQKYFEKGVMIGSVKG